MDWHIATALSKTSVVTYASMSCEYPAPPPGIVEMPSFCMAGTLVALPWLDR